MYFGEYFKFLRKPMVFDFFIVILQEECLKGLAPLC